MLWHISRCAATCDAGILYGTSTSAPASSNAPGEAKQDDPHTCEPAIPVGDPGRVPDSWLQSGSLGSGATARQISQLLFLFVRLFFVILFFK